MKNVSNYKNDPDTKKKIRITKKKQQKKILEKKKMFWDSNSDQRISQLVMQIS